LAVAVGLMGGCGGGAASGGPDGSTAGAGAAVDAAGWMAVGTAAAPVPVSFVLKDVYPDEPDMIGLLEQIESKMAAHGQYLDITLVEPPTDSYASALPLAVRSGEMKADVLYFQGGDLPVAQDGLLEDLGPYVEKSTYVKAMLDDSGREKLANYPYLLYLATPRVSVPVMRQDLAERLSSYPALKADPSLDAYYAFFKEMVDKGLVRYATTMDGTLDRLDSVFNHAFGVTGTVVKEDGKWIYAMASQAEKAKLEFYAKLYADGLLDPEYLVDKWDTMEQKFYESAVGFVAGTAGDVIQIYNTKMMETQGAPLVVLPPAKGVSWAYKSVDNTKEPRGYAINGESKQKDAAFALLEFMASPEGRLLDKVGLEGVHYNLEGGKIVFTDKFPEWWARIFPTPMNLNPATPLAQPVLSAPAQSSVDASLEYYAADTNVLVPNEMAPQYDAMRSLYLEYSTDIITGKKPASAFGEFVEKFNAAGGREFERFFAEQLQ
jgi:putative aldouronate transport system substrate-binding protein